MRSFICKLVYWIMLKLYVFILWALLPLLTMGKGILIQNVVIFDGKSEKTVTGNVWIEDNAIRKVSAEPIVAGAEVEVIDGRGKFLMPGLIDAHWHAYLAANTMVDLLTAHASYTQLRAGEEAGKTLLRGFTTIRDAGGPVFGLKRAIDEGTLPGPRIYPSGAIISETGGHADFRMVYDIPEPFDCCGLTHTEKIGAAIIADGVDAVIVASRNNLRLGASQIKLMAGGGVSSLYDQLEDVQYFEDELHAAVIQRHRLGKGQGQGGFSHAGVVLQQDVAPGQNGHEHLAHHGVLPQDGLAHLVYHSQRFGLQHKRPPPSIALPAWRADSRFT